MLAVVGITGEWRHRTITSSLLAAPDRTRFLAAKTLAFTSAGLLLSLLISLPVTVLGMAILLVRDLPTPDAGELAAQIGRNAVVAMLLGALGVGIGAAVRNQVVAVVAMLAVLFVVEPVLIGLAPDVGRYGPFVALPTAAAGIPEADAGLQGVDLLAPAVAMGLMLAWTSLPAPRFCAAATSTSC